MYDDSQMYIAFRGTDDSIVAWKEDFMMSFSVIPAQKFALDFLKHVISRHPNTDFIVGGHSKGGNLAIYSCAMCDELFRDRCKQEENRLLPNRRGKVPTPRVEKRPKRI